ncbi:sensor domain-containing protein [Marinomonas transparens]|uniref:cyclic-guanylate-specific phosphodiesterase n=1 Tax=Marinomonas transparens TaxID=2795388 RepID=A0A934JPE2_9GAMM|nr:bifunctional diguanylate cyclase/phosphodiesterase [Marinomonas transparens]MBJ7539506.1 EAL domain-containing protein [Marinomonas transparens]
MTIPWVTTFGYLVASFLLIILIRKHFQLRTKNHNLSKQLELLQQQPTQITIAFEASPIPIWIKDNDSIYLFCNQAFEQLIGINRSKIIGHTDEEILSYNSQAKTIIPTITSATKTRKTEQCVFLKDNKTAYFNVLTTSTYDKNNNPTGLIGHAHAITALKEREIKLIETELRISEALKLTKVGIWEWDIAKDVWFATPSYFTMLGYSPVEGLADRKAELEKVHPEDRELILNTIKSVLNNEEPSNYYKYQARIKHINGEYRWVSVRCIVTEYNEQNEPTLLLGVRIDINEIKKTYEKMEWLAHHDSITKLPNKAALNKTFNLIAQTDKKLALLSIDLDHFKNINNTLGHSIGDQLVLTVADRMRTLAKDDHYVARQGDDEFIILLSSENEKELKLKAIEIKEALAERYHIDQHQFFITPSIGISLYPQDSKNFDALYKQADTAKYHAKNVGRNSYAFFTQEMQATSTRALLLENALHDAIARDEFTLHYQPQISLSSGKITGAEALIRWHSRNLGNVSPSEFIPLAEDSGQILAISEWVLRETTRQIKQWINDGFTAIRVSVNLSYAQFQVDNFPGLVSQILVENNLPPHYLELELTERVATRAPENTIKVLESFQQLGIQAAIDDFGTGYSSLSYLQRFPVHKLKIDQSFVRNMTTNKNDHVIVGTIILLAQQLGMTTIAEGVETKAQLDALKNIGCDDIQGYFISRPIPPDEFQTTFLNKELSLNSKSK